MVGTLLEPPSPRLCVRRLEIYEAGWVYGAISPWLYNTLPFQIAMKGEWVTSVAVQPMEHWHSAREHREIRGGVGGWFEYGEWNVIRYFHSFIFCSAFRRVQKLLFTSNVLGYLVGVWYKRCTWWVTINGCFLLSNKAAPYTCGAGRGGASAWRCGGISKFYGLLSVCAVNQLLIHAIYSPILASYVT